MDTLCAQAYGAGQFKELGRVMQRGILILGLTCIPIVTLWCFAEPLLILARQDPMVASKSGHYVLGFIPGVATVCRGDGVWRVSSPSCFVFVV